MKALLISPPFVPMYVNTDYNFVEIGEVAAYLNEDPCIELTVADCSVLNCSWNDVLAKMLDGYDALIIHNTIENFESVRKAVELARSLDPQVPIATYGRLAVHMPRAFERLGIDVIVMEQDWEVALRMFCSVCDRGVHESVRSLSDLPGCRVNYSGAYRYGGPGQHLREDWRVPDLSSLPLDDYRVFDDEGLATPSHSVVKPAGEIAIGMSRGCDSKCGYCPIPKVNGYRERYRERLEEVATYFSTGESRYNFATASLFSANFTRHPAYVRAFCRAFLASCHCLTWTCVTEPTFLAEDLVFSMAEARCSRVAIGVESFRDGGGAFYTWRKDAKALECISSWFERAGVKLVGFVMVGIPGQTRKDIAYTLKTLRDMGIVPRPMVYCNFHEMASLSSPEDSFWFNRQLVASEACTGSITNRERMLITKDWQRWLRDQS